MRVPKLPQFVPFEILLLAGAFGGGEMAPQRHHIRTLQLGLVGQQLLQSRVNLCVTLREPVAQVLRDALDLEIAAWPVPHAISEAAQFPGEFIVIGILGKLPGAQQLVVLKRPPPILGGVERCVEHDAVRVQVRVKRA